jgi:glycosyltransferase involved in cell wall biosynthesis
MSPSLGVLITYFNEKELLRECLQSLVGGGARPDEILIYDDASEYPAKDYVPDGIPVQIIRGETNRGPSVGRNTLMRHSQSQYIHFQDADDLFDGAWIGRVRKAIDETGADAVFTEISSVRPDGRRSERILNLERIVKGGDLLRFCLQGPLLVPSGTYKRETVLSIGGYKETRWQSEDFDFHVRLARRGIRFAVIDEPLISIRIRPESRSQNAQEVWRSTLGAVEEFAQELPADYQGELAEVAATTGSMLYRAGDKVGATRAFRLAYRLGPATFRHQLGPYRWIARLCGPEKAEQVVGWYQRFFPRSARPAFWNVARRFGWQSKSETFY